MTFRQFYPGDCRRQIADMLRDFEAPTDLDAPRAVVVPHAGWRYSGAVAARTLKTLAGFGAESLLLFSAVHRAYLGKAALYPEGAWETPLGEVPVDETLAEEILARCGDLVTADRRAHDDEHALEVLMPFIREFFPETPVVPVMVPPHAEPVELGTRFGEIVGRRNIAAVASTDLTHYGRIYQFTPAGSGPEAHEWMRANDRRVIERAVRLEAEDVVAEARAHQNACGSGALAAAVAYARALGAARGTLLERTDSHEVESPEAPFQMAVGYAGIAL